MLPAYDFLVNFQSLFIQGFSFDVVARILVEIRKIVQARCCIGMLLAKYFLANLQSFFVQ
jgi:hypothetical protein